MIHVKMVAVKMDVFYSNMFLLLPSKISEIVLYLFRMSDMYSALSDEVLDSIIAQIQLSHPNTGYRMMRAFLLARRLRVQSKFYIKSPHEYIK